LGGGILWLAKFTEKSNRIWASTFPELVFFEGAILWKLATRERFENSRQSNERSLESNE
jgi:hypothetical protein